MGASYLQTSFLGGQWSPTAQGRADEEAYRTALNRSFNALPVEAGAHTRRPGTQAPSTSRKGRPGIVREFHFSQAAPYNLEFTDGILRIWAGPALLLEFVHAVASVSTANPAVISVPAVDTDWVVGDTIELTMTPALAGTSPAGVGILFNRQFQLGAGSDGTHFTLLDPVTGAGINGATIDTTNWNVSGAKVLEFTTPYTFGTAWKTTQVRVVQDQDVAFILVPGFKPATLANVGTSTSPVFQWTAPGSVVFKDGPYLDPPTDGSTLTPNAQSGNITLTASSIASINAGAGFKSTDVGRFVRLFSEPLDWSAGTTYSTGDQVRFETGAGPAYYQAIVKNHGVQPDTDNGTNWSITTTAAAWTWAIITVVTNTTHVNATVQGSFTDIFQQPLAGGSLKTLNPIKTWRLGSWSDTTGYPTTGGFHEGRFWFAGSVKNRFEATMSQENYNFAPTLLDGTVADNNGISETIKSKDENSIFWVVSVEEGLILGTQGGEWAVRASQLGEAITPTSITAKKATRYGCANIEPRDTGLSHIFVQRYNKQVYEYLADVYSRKFSGTNIARRARDLTSPGVVELAYTFENVPCLWARTAQDKLIGCTYKRESPFSTQPASFYGWHYHTLGSNRAVHSISAGPSPDGTVDSLCLLTYDSVTGIHFVEFMTPAFEETGTLLQSWFLDGAITPTYAEVIGTTVVFYGLNYLIGDTVTAWIGGLDAGDYVVSAAGTITVPIDGSANPLLTLAKLATLTAQGGFGALGVSIVVSPQGTGFASPIGVALTYNQNHLSFAAFGPAGTSAVDWDNNVFYASSAVSLDGEPSTNGRVLYYFNAVTRAEIACVNPGEFGFGLSAVLGQDGHLYFGTIDSANLVGRFNVTSQIVDVVYNDSHSLDKPNFPYIETITSGGGIYVCFGSLTSGVVGSRVNVINMTGPGSPAFVSPTFVIDEAPGSLTDGNAFPIRGPAGSCYVVGIIPAQLGIYEVVVDGPLSAAMGKIGAITPASVHAGWTTFTFESGIFDETDGNLLLLLHGSDSTNRLVKVSTRTAAVLWTLQVTSSVDFRTSRIRGARFSFLDGTGPYTLKFINTLTGAVVSTQATNAIAPSFYFTDDGFGEIIVQVNNTNDKQWATFGCTTPSGVITPAVIDNAPAVIGFNYVSQGQILRPVLPQETMDQTGPGLGKTRRSQMYAALMVNTQGVKVGTDFTKMHTAPLVSAGRTQPLAKDVLFTDVIQGTLDDTASFHSMWAWQTDRPYPTTISSVEVFLIESPR